MLTHRTYGTRLALEGTLDDQANLAATLDHAKQGKLALDLGGIRFINSVGVREWIRFLAAATKAGVTLSLHRVPVVMVHQFNLVPATRGATILSFMVPYLCPECDAEADYELTPTEAKGMPPKACPDCRNDMAFRDPPAIYLSFLGG